MPSHSDRVEVSVAHNADLKTELTGSTFAQIMQACSRKIALDPSINLVDYAEHTKGYSGADLQAFVYNAHLAAIHETLAASEASTETSKPDKSLEHDVAYTTIGGSAEQASKVLSRAEQAVVNKRVRRRCLRALNPKLTFLVPCSAGINNELAFPRADWTDAPNSNEWRCAFEVDSKLLRRSANHDVTLNSAQTRVQGRHLEKSLKTTRPSVPSDELARLERMWVWKPHKFRGRYLTDVLLDTAIPNSWMGAVRTDFRPVRPATRSAAGKALCRSIRSSLAQNVIVCHLSRSIVGSACISRHPRQLQEQYVYTFLAKDREPFDRHPQRHVSKASIT